MIPVDRINWWLSVSVTIRRVQVRNGYELFSCCRVETCWLRPVSLEWNFRSVSSNLR